MSSVVGFSEKALVALTYLEPLGRIGKFASLNPGLGQVLLLQRALHRWSSENTTQVGADMRPACPGPRHSAGPATERDRIRINRRVRISHQPWAAVSFERGVEDIEQAAQFLFRTGSQLGMGRQFVGRFIGMQIHRQRWSQRAREPHQPSIEDGAFVAASDWRQIAARMRLDQM